MQGPHQPEWHTPGSSRRRRRRLVRARRIAWAAVAVAVAAAVVAIAMGGGDRGAGGVGGQDRTAGVRWYVPTSGSAASIAAENRQPGTTAWQLVRTSSRPPALAAYVSAQSVAPGELERVYADAPGSAWIAVAIYRMGWYGGSGGRLMLTSRRFPAVRQPPCRHRESTGLTECMWHPTLSVRLPRSLVSGVYIVKLTDSRGEQRDAMFVLEGAGSTPMLVQIPLATYEAYNNWGGDGLYPGYRRVPVTGTSQGVEESFDRPYDSTTGAGQFFKFDVTMVRFLEHQGYPLAYTTGVAVDTRPGLLAGRRLVLDVGHSEYWSQRDVNSFAGARDSGTNLAFVSSDTAAWRVRYAPATGASSEAGTPAHRILAYKEYAARDPDQGLPSGPLPTLGASLTGTAFNRCITPPAGPGKYRYYAWRPDSTLTPSWLYRGTGLTPTSEVGGIVGYELDSTTPSSPPGTLVVGSGAAPCRGAPGSGVAESTLYRARSGALVFATGALGWEFGLSPLPQVSPDVPRQADPRLVRLTDNVIRRMLGRATG